MAHTQSDGGRQTALEHFGSIKLAANQTVSVKEMLKDDKAP